MQIMYKHILFATDLTEETDYIVTKVQALRGFSGAKLSIVHIVEPMPGYSYAYLGIEDIEGQLIEEAREALTRLGTKLAVERSDQWIEVGPTKVNADLIICGSHGRHGLSLLLGSTANAILHGSKCDVLTVRLPE
jgi:universal stress protein A